MGMYENPPYYLSAYALACKYGFEGSIEEWLGSLKGEKGDSPQFRYANRKIQIRYGPEDPWEDLAGIGEYADAVSQLVEEGQRAIDEAVARTDAIWEAYSSGELAQRPNVVLYADKPPDGLTPVAADGVTDDTAALQALVSYAGSHGGGTIVLQPGVIRTTGRILWADGVSMRGAGMEITTIRPEGTGWSAIAFDDTEGEWGEGENGDEPRFHGITFESFGIDGEATTGSGSAAVGTKGIFLTYMERCTFRDLLIQNTIGTGLGVDFLRDCLIDNVHAINCGRLWTSGGLGQAGIGIGTGGMPEESMVIRHCVARECGHFGIFVEIQDFSDGRVQQKSQKILIDGCAVDGGRYDGINAYYADDLVISNCRSTGNARHGISFSGGGQRGILRDCTVEDNATDGIYIYCPNAAQSKKDLSITGCLAFANGRNGINIDVDSSTGSIENLRILACDAFENAAAGIRLGSDGTADHAQISGNRVHDNEGQGIILNISGDWQRVANNEIYGNGTAATDAGLYVGGEHESLVIEGNLIWGNRVGHRTATGSVITGAIARGNLRKDNDAEVLTGATYNGCVEEMPVTVTQESTITTPEPVVMLNGTAAYTVEPNGTKTLIAGGRYQTAIQSGSTVPESMDEGDVFILV